MLSYKSKEEKSMIGRQIKNDTQKVNRYTFKVKRISEKVYK